IRHRDELRDETGDPWDGRSLEWSTSSPPPFFNYARLPHVENEEPYWTIKQRAMEEQRPGEDESYEPIEMPRNSPTGFVTAFFSTLIGFALIWHIWWLAILGFIGAYITFVVFAWREHGDYEVSAEEVERIDRDGRAAQ
ncbi:MAG: cytochrome o ubiquinol oxidase subunit I, partial [Mesorhizobium sp.]